METINIKFDEKQLEDVVKKVIENIMKKAKEESTTEKPEKRVRMYLEANEFGVDSELKRVYFGFVYNTLNSESASCFNLEHKRERVEVEELKKQGWKEEVFYK